VVEGAVYAPEGIVLFGVGAVEADGEPGEPDIYRPSNTVTFFRVVPRDDDQAPTIANYLVDPLGHWMMRFPAEADPSKVKSYLSAALPIVMSDVPPVARTLEKAGAAVITEPRASDIAGAARSLLQDRAAWEQARQASAELADALDWNRVLDAFFARLGWGEPSR